MKQKKHLITSWIARIAVLATFCCNIWCIISFLNSPDYYATAYELSGVPGRAAIQGIAVAFLMWNVTYPLVIIDPLKYRTLFVIVLIQQAVGLVGETIIYAQIGAGYPLLSTGILRFVMYDFAGLIAMGISFIALSVSLQRAKKTGTSGT